MQNAAQGRRKTKLILVTRVALAYQMVPGMESLSEKSEI
jgi:hypothetical protein